MKDEKDLLLLNDENVIIFAQQSYVCVSGSLCVHYSMHLHNAITIQITGFSQLQVFVLNACFPFPR